VKSTMEEDGCGTGSLEERLRASEERLRLVEAASGIATFELDLDSWRWDWSAQAASILGFNPHQNERTFAEGGHGVFIDDAPKIRAAIEGAAQGGSFYVEFRVRHADQSLHWMAGKGQLTPHPGSSARLLRGAIYEITDRKALEARLLALNETLEARVREAREEAHTLEVLNSTGSAVAAEHD
jgi:PAS domain-containing protein